MLRMLMFAVSLAAMGTEAAAQAPGNPVITPYGKIAPAPNAAMQPDPELDYRVVFSISKAPPAPDKLNPSLEKVAPTLGYRVTLEQTFSTRPGVPALSLYRVERE